MVMLIWWCGSFKRNLVELLQLVQTWVPLVEYFKEVNQVHRYLLHKVLGVLIQVVLHGLLTDAWHGLQN